MTAHCSQTQIAHQSPRSHGHLNLDPIWFQSGRIWINSSCSGAGFWSEFDVWKDGRTQRVWEWPNVGAEKHSLKAFRNAWNLVSSSLLSRAATLRSVSSPLLLRASTSCLRCSMVPMYIDRVIIILALNNSTVEDCGGRTTFFGSFQDRIEWYDVHTPWLPRRWDNILAYACSNVVQRMKCYVCSLLKLVSIFIHARMLTCHCPNCKNPKLKKIRHFNHTRQWWPHNVSALWHNSTSWTKQC